MAFQICLSHFQCGNHRLITSYTKGVLKDKLQTGIILLILVLLYSYLYIVLQLQDLALMIGSIGLFSILSLVMYLTRKIDWFSTLQLPGPAGKQPETPAESDEAKEG
jgi:Inner membrane protein involved in colicin E2 resistance